MNIVFSDKTYQVEIDGIWVFLQLGEGREAVDRFCNCEKASAEGNCAHIGQAIDRIYGGTPLPLHKRYGGSLEEQIAFLLYRRHGMNPTFFRDGNAILVVVESFVHFSIDFTDPVWEKTLFDLLENRV